VEKTENGGDSIIGIAVNNFGGVLYRVYEKDAISHPDRFIDGWIQ